MKISKVKSLEINKITDLIESRTLELILKGLSEEGSTLMVEEKDEKGNIARVPLSKQTLQKYWTRLCEYFGHFLSGKHECIDDTKKRAKEIIDGNIIKPKVVHCHLGLSVIAIPFVFKDKVIGVLFGGKKRLRGGEVYEKLKKFAEEICPSILKEEAVWDGKEEEEQWRGKRFDLSEVKGLIDEIPEISEEDFQEEIKKLNEAADYIVKVGENNYYAQSRLRNQQFLFDIMEYFVNVYSVGKTPLKDIMESIIEEITEFARTRCGLFAWGKECITTHYCERAGIVSCSSPGDKICEIKDLIKDKFEKKEEVYYLSIGNLRDIGVIEGIKSFAGITPVHSVYAKSILLRNQSEGFFVFVDPAGKRKGFDKDCAEFLSLVAERIKSQIDIYLTDEDRSEFMTEMTHRLKSPMQYIMSESGYLDAHLKEKHLDDLEAQSVVQEIIDGVLHLDHQLRNYSYITTLGKKDWDYGFGPHPIITLVKKCVRRFQPSAKDRGIRIFTKIPEESVDKRTEFDWDTMDIAVSNLLDNAVKYSHFDRDIFVDVSFDDTAEIYTITVSDRGLGIDPDEYEKILEKYYRGKNMRDRIRWIPGTGLGLSVVDEIVRAHQGRINVTSKLLKEKEKGDVYHTIFGIFLPYHRQKGGKNEENSIY